MKASELPAGLAGAKIPTKTVKIEELGLEFVVHGLTAWQRSQIAVDDNAMLQKRLLGLAVRDEDGELIDETGEVFASVWMHYTTPLLEAAWELSFQSPGDSKELEKN